MQILYMTIKVVLFGYHSHLTGKLEKRKTKNEPLTPFILHVLLSVIVIINHSNSFLIGPTKWVGQYAGTTPKITITNDRFHKSNTPNELKSF